MTGGFQVWTSLSTSPLLWIAVTLAAYLAGQRFQDRMSGKAWASPVLIAITLCVTVLSLTGTPYRQYFAGAQFIHFLLGPVTVALGVPLARNIRHVRQSLAGITIALIAGSAVSIVSGILLVVLLGGSKQIAISMAPKAVTTPIAMAVVEQVGGLPALTAVLAILGGVIAAITGEPLLRRFGVKDWRAHGLAAGVAGSGVAASQVAGRDPLAAAFSALGIGINGLVTALMAPLIIRFLS
ncbi:LrgB family protein [Sphingobium baderi]|uniref:LrgB family protein n=1 Tax=Sphingobium baderi TaxID=1332080 RepID=UPI000AF1FC36|nr:LrgB family protein [Sphingobium baderi]